ncbi:M56 family metallopeptidase [Zobellia uliginosa]|uniref:M56 family metallopeptidase n=1 Tax=Zobellia uliginosa TaxID=143224 RepID=UPI001C07CA74|nr:M56 family metallopeptidase [Zobellia uliginosa]MBU2947721.1 M56 family metallopeptidase [Zobellia uliginosa]
MILFLIKSAACMAIFLTFYKLLLEKESMHTFKRFYLLGALFISFIIPSIVFTEVVAATPINVSIETQNIEFIEDAQITQPIATDSKFNWELALWSVYGIGVLGFGFRFFRHLFQIGLRIRKNPKLKTNFSVKVLLKEQLPPHTFFSYIFLNRQKYEAKIIPNEVLLHEETHAKQKHSIDVLLIEFLQVIFWFNPLTYLFKKSIKLNHEFLADSAVIINSKDPIQYQNTLLSYLSNDSFNHYQSAGIANAINYSSIKKRFKIMKKQTSKKGIVLRCTLLLPLLAILLFGFSETKTIIQNENAASKIIMTDSEKNPEIEKYNALAKKYNAIPIEKRVIPLKDLYILETIYRNMSKAQKEEAHPFPECLPKKNQDGATKKQITSYNYLAKKYNTMMDNGANVHIVKSDVDQLNRIYGLMSAKQKENGEPFPDFPEPPAIPEAPNVSKDEKSNIPHPQTPNTKIESSLNFPAPPRSPHAPKTLNTTNYANKQLKEIIENQDPYDHLNLDAKAINGIPSNTHTFYSKPSSPVAPPSPPTPASPLDYAIDMAKKGATFFYEGKKVSSNKAIDLLKKNKELNIESREKNGKAEVRITKEPVTIR